MSAVAVEPQAHSNLEVAVRLASRGVHVFPCKPDKSPYTPSGFKDATTDELTIRRWWKQYPDALPAIACRASGLIIVDCDKKGVVDGVATIDGVGAFQAIARDNGIAVWECPIVETPSGGAHCYFKLPSDMEPTNRTGTLPPGIDVRSAGYVIAPGARLPDGRCYNGLAEMPELATAYSAGSIPELPLALRKLIESRRQSEARQRPSVAEGVGGQPTEPALPRSPPSAREMACAAKALKDEVTHLASLGEGSHRNAALNTAAHAMGTMSGPGWIDRSTVECALHAACHQNGYLDKDGETAVLSTLRSGIEAGMRNPRAPLADSDVPILPSVVELVEQATVAHRAMSQTAHTQNGERLAALPNSCTITAKHFEWRDPATIPQRRWLYGNHYIRRFISATIAPGGVGKSSLIIAEAIAMATGRTLVGLRPVQPLRVWVFNGEDPLEEMERRVGAFMLHHGITNDEIGNRLYLNSGRDTEFFIAETTANKTTVNIPAYDAIVKQIRLNGIDVLIIDPFISSHKVSENDNNGIDLVIKTWNKIANDTGCAIELVHHARKSNGGETSVDDARGASALTAAARSVRAINRMSKEQADKAGIEADKMQDYFRVNVGKANLARASNKGMWYEMKGISLMNGDAIADASMPITLPGDIVGVVTGWVYPATATEIDVDVIEHVQSIVRGGDYRANEQSPNWVGYVICGCFGVDNVASSGAKRNLVRKYIKQLVDEGWLIFVKGHDVSRRDKTFVAVGKSLAP